MFSLTDDFLSPGEVCIKPLQISKKKPRDDVVDDLPLAQKVAVSLQDCLACAGCVTSAESVLIAAQSEKEFFSRLPQARLSVVSMAPEAVASLAAHFGLPVAGAFGRLSTLFRREFGVHAVLSTGLADRVAVAERRAEFERHLEEGGRKAPLLASSCPGWICFAEKSHPETLPAISRVQSGQQIMGTIVKRRAEQSLGLPPGQVYHACVMMCYDKKLEASRDDFRAGDGASRTVDTVLATSEILGVIRERGINFVNLAESSNEAPYDALFGDLVDPHGDGQGSGAQAADLFRWVARKKFGVVVEEVPFKAGRNVDVREAVLEVEGKQVMKVCVANGFRNIQNVVRKLKGAGGWDFVEVMACPSGCLNGGGQIRADNPADREAAKEKLAQTVLAYRSKASPGEDLEAFYRDFVGGAPGSDKARQLFYTQYHPVPPLDSSIAVNW